MAKKKTKSLTISAAEIAIIEKQLEENGLSKSDSALVEIYIQHWKQWREATKKIEEQGLVVPTPNNFMQPNPYLSIQKVQAEILKKMTNELGLSPLSRKRAGVEKPLCDDDDLCR